MLLKVTHATDLVYSDLISNSVTEIRMCPRQEQDQHRLSFALAVGPGTQAHMHFDWLGNVVHWFTINAFHQQVKIVATSVVETDRPMPQPQRFKDTWPIKGLDNDYSVYDYLQFGGPVQPSAHLTELAVQLHAEEGLSLGELALRMMYLLADKFTYQKGVTSAASPIEHILKSGSGVCQDFTHLMIGLARALHIPARYVSGIVHPEESQKFRGASQTHAWCELLFPSAGWIGFDPTNTCIVGGNFVKIAYGRDYHDVPPNKGQYAGKDVKETIDVRVTTEALTGIPSELAAERMQALPIPSYTQRAQYQLELVNQQQEHQQQ